MTASHTSGKSVGKPTRKGVEVKTEDQRAVDKSPSQNKPGVPVSHIQRIGGWLRRDEEGQDFALGLPVIIYARWVLVIAGFVLVVWNGTNRDELVLTILVVLGLAIANFFLHVQILQNKKVDVRIAYGASVGDIFAITAVLAVAGTFPSALYVFYMPALLAIAVTFSSRVTAGYGVAAVVAYTIVALTDSAYSASDDLGVLLTHMIILAAVPICGNIYWRMEKQRTESTELLTIPSLTNERSTSSFEEEAPHE